MMLRPGKRAGWSLLGLAISPGGAGADPRWSGIPTISGMPTLVEAWDAAIAAEPDDWSHATVELVLDDAERMEEAALLACGANPWHLATLSFP